MSDIFTTTGKFELMKPASGSFYGSWDAPMNTNFDKIDEVLFNLFTSNKLLNSADITDPGVIWYGTLPNGTANHLYVKNSEGDFQQLITSEDIPWEGLKSGFNTIIDLHSHPGYSSQFFKVKNPELASGGDVNKINYAVPYNLFKTNLDATNQSLSSIISAIGLDASKLQGLSVDGIDLSIGSMEASGTVTANGLLTKAGTTDVTAKIGGGSSATELEITLTRGLPINIKAVDTQTSELTELQVEGNKVWHEGNQGTGSGLDADRVDGKEVDDTTATVNNIWTALKTASELDKKLAVEIFSTFMDEYNNHKSLNGSDHDAHNDARYLKAVNQFNTPLGGIIAWSPLFNESYALGQYFTVSTGAPREDLPAKYSELKNFRLCNGQGGTVDLRGRFILSFGDGSGNKDLAGKNGVTGFLGTGSETIGVRDGEQDHTLSIAEMPSHSHYFGSSYGSFAGPQSALTLSSSYATATSSTGANTPHNNLPPFITLAYIQRVK